MLFNRLIELGYSRICTWVPVFASVFISVCVGSIYVLSIIKLKSSIIRMCIICVCVSCESAGSQNAQIDSQHS